MKHLTFLLALIFSISVSKTNAQRGPVTSSGSSSSGSSFQSGSREVSNYNFNNGSNSSGGSVNYTTSPAATYSAPSQAVTYRSSTPAAGYTNMGTPNTSSTAYAPGTVSYGNNYSAAYTQGSVHNAHPTIMRYNYSAKGVYPYYPSANKKHKDDRRDEHLARVARENNNRQLLPYTSFNDFCNIPVTIGSQTSYYTGYSNANTAINVSLDGYVVYGDDTLSGIVTITPEAVLLDQSIDSTQEEGYKFPYNDNAMKSVVVFKGDDELYLTRTSANDSALLRVLHAGKLYVYDDVYAFPTTENVDQRNVQFAYGDKLRSINSLVILDWRTPLMKAINKAYGLKLHTADMSWNKLLLYMNKLD